MIKNNKILYGLFTLFVGFALSLNTAIAQETNQDAMTNDSFIGKVVDATTNQPLPNVEVEVEGQTFTTDQDGKFTFDDQDLESQTQNQGVESQGVESEGMASGEIEIKINHEGYEELTETVSVDELRQRAQAQGQEQQTQQQEDQQFGQEQEDIKTFKLQPEEY